MNINCILLVLLLLASVVVLKCTSFLLVIDTFPKLRLIVSPIGTFNYDLVRFPCHHLSPVLPDDYSCKDTFSFVFQIKSTNLWGKFVVSYNVTSPFINMPLQETIATINIIFNHNPNINITTKELKKTFPFCYITDPFSF